MSFIVPVRDDAERLRQCLRSIMTDTRHVLCEVIVADNGSTDGSAGVAHSLGVTVLSLPARSVAAVRNEAAARARGELLAFIDADHRIEPGWSAAALRLMQDSHIWGAGAEYHPPPDASWVQAMYDRFRQHPAGPEIVDWLPSGNLVVRRSVFERLHGFDQRLESCEDVDFCSRIRQSGGTLVASEELRSIHYGDPKTLLALFRSELWRGRDNLRVSLREPLTIRSAPGLVIPIVNLCGLVAIGAGLVTAGRGGAWLLLAGAGVFFALVSLRALSLVSQRRNRPQSARTWVEAWLVAGTYDLARAIALIARATHRVRRKGDA